MIKALFKAYKVQIFFAFALVIVENVTFIAEPYIFGQAIDDLREANVIEQEVDSTIANTLVRQAIDSVREHLLDSLMQRDSLRDAGMDSLESSLLPGKSENSGSDFQSERNHGLKVRATEGFFIATALYEPQGNSFDETIVKTPKQLAREREAQRRAKRDSIRTEFDKNFQIVSTAHSDSARREGLRKLGLPPAARRKIREILAERDSMRQLLHAGKLGKVKAHKSSRDSIRSRVKQKPHTKPSIAEDIQQIQHPVSFFLPKDIAPFIPAMMPWVILYIISSSVGAWRRYYDTKIYTRMFANLSSEVVAKQLKMGEDISKIAGRSSLAWGNIEFFQYSLPEFIEQLINVGGAIGALAIFDWRLATVGAALVLIVIVTNRFYMRNVGKYQATLNDMHEQEYNTFATRDPSIIKKYYTDISGLEVKLSNRAATNYGMLRFLLLFMFLTTLYISLDLDRFTIGEIYSIVAYVWTFVTASEYIPYLSEKWVNLRDVTRRLETDDMLEFGDISLK